MFSAISPRITITHVRLALVLPNFDYESAQRRMSPIPRPVLPENQDRPVREAGVLILIYPEADGELHLILTRRADNPQDPHSGQISFPGGQRDTDDSSFTITALRETCEEVGICGGITIWGSLSPVYIPPSHYRVYPYIGTLPVRPDCHPNPVEVAEVFTLALDDLLDDAHKRSEDHEYRGAQVTVPFYDVKGHKVWGATAVILSELEHRLRAVLR